MKKDYVGESEMTNKPPKRGDLKQKEAKMARKKKEILSCLPPYIFIATEGTVTEQNYLQGFIERINSKYGRFSTKDRVQAKGFGRSCLSLLDDTRNHISKNCPHVQEVWLVYDKDDFPSDAFDNTQFSAFAKKYNVAWSNESVELWFLLHFQDVSTNIGREKYIELLEMYCDYAKNDPGLYNKLCPRTGEAMDRAIRMYNGYDENASPSSKCPATLMFKLIARLTSLVENELSG